MSSKESSDGGAINTNIKRGRGRPKGSKNKPKGTPSADESKPPAVAGRGRGRPKGSKNKPKTGTTAPTVPQESVQRAPITEKVIVHSFAEDNSELSAETLDNHPLMSAVSWIEKNMHHSQMSYYRARASRTASTLQHVIAADILGFFTIQDAPILKQIKKNNFITHVTKHELHQ